MILNFSLDLAQALGLIASIFAVVSGVIGFARFLKRWWQQPVDPTK